MDIIILDLPNVVALLVCPKVDFMSRNMMVGLQKP